MRTCIALILTLMLASIGLAQRAQNNTDEKLQARNAPGLFVYSASAFGPDKNGDSNFTIEVGNTDVRTIVAIEWEYRIARDVAESVEPDHRTFLNGKISLMRNERRKLTQQVHHYTDKFVIGFNLDTVRIMKVEYEDGSSWQRPADPR